MIENIKQYFQQKRFSAPIEKKAGEAYDLWAATYDQQPGNLMLDLDKIVFNNLIENVTLKDKVIADVGCGTGRHWPAILSYEPAQLRGYDISAGMLNKLIEKFPKAIATQTSDDLLADLANGSCDLLLSTLTMAHLLDAGKALKAWCRVVKEKGDIIITDFHPDTLAKGGKRIFRHQGQSISVENFIYSVSSIKKILLNEGFVLVYEEERCIEPSVRHYYEEQNALTIYNRYKGMPIIYGLHFKRGDGIE